jgi:hypothetical protein
MKSKTVIAVARIVCSNANPSIAESKEIGIRAGLDLQQACHS